MLTRLLQLMLDNGGGAVPALKFRADNFGQVELLDTLETDGWIQRSQDQYVVHSVALPLLETEPAKRLMAGIEKIYAVLRTQYLAAQIAPVKLDHIATATGLPRAEVSAAIRMMLDTTLWWSGAAGDPSSPEASVSPAEKVLQFETFAELAAEVRSWHKPQMGWHPGNSVLDALRESEGGAMSAPKRDSMREVTLARGTWTLLQDRVLGNPGGFAAVYLGLSARGDAVAIKVFHSTDPAMSKRELDFARQRAGHQDAHVIPVLDCGVDAATGHACIVMPKAEYSLAQRLEQGHLSEPEAVVIGHAVVSGLLSAENWVHRDLKPGNLLWCQGRWQIADFGIARQADARTALSTMKAYLSAPYGAPEQWNSEHATHKTDVYALGCVLQEVMTGEPPFPGPDWPDYARQHRSESPTGLAGSDRMKTMLSRMLNKSPDARPGLVELEQRFGEWERSAPQSPAAQGLAALAAKLAGADAQQQAARATAEQRARSRATLETDAQRELKDLANLLLDRIEHMAANALIDRGRGPTPDMSVALGAGKMWLSLGQFKRLPPDRFSESGWDVICGATVSVAQQDGRGRSASFWYARLGTDSAYEWVEVSYWFLGQSDSWHLEPCLLPPEDDADLAASNIMHSWNLAHPPISLAGDEKREAFIDRWLTRFTAVAAGEYRRPSTLPESR